MRRNSWGHKELDTTERLNWTDTCLCRCIDVCCICVMFFYLQRVLPKLPFKKAKHFTKLPEILKLKENDYMWKIYSSIFTYPDPRAYSWSSTSQLSSVQAITLISLEKFVSGEGWRPGHSVITWQSIVSSPHQLLFFTFWEAPFGEALYTARDCCFMGVYSDSFPFQDWS